MQFEQFNKTKKIYVSLKIFHLFDNNIDTYFYIWYNNIVFH